MNIEERPTSLIIKLNNLKENLKIVKRLIKRNTKILAVVKADAYGHGIKQISKFLYSLGIGHFGVATTEEAITILENLPHATVLNFGKIYKKDIEISKRFRNYILTFSSFDCFNYISEKDSIKIHLKIDTGMGRCGIFPEEINFFLEKLKLFKNIKFEGVYSHFPSADEDKNFTLMQIENFKKIKSHLNIAGFKNLIFHISNSDGIINFPEANFDMVRPGIMLYGSYWDEGKRKTLGLKPVMKLVSKVVDIKIFKKGMSVGYKRKFIIPEDNYKTALIPIGYGDGYTRFFSNCGEVLINGKKCKVIGLVSMDWIIVDVSNLDNVKIGDEVIFFGDEDGKLSVDYIAQKIGTISYEIFCNINHRVKRIYKN